MKKAIIIGGEHAAWPVKNAEWVKQAGFDVTLLFFSEPKPVYIPAEIGFRYDPLKPSVVERLLLIAWFLINGLFTLLGAPFFLFKEGHFPTKHMYFANNPILARKRARAIDALKPDLVIGQNADIAGLTVALSKVPKKIIIGWGVDFIETYRSSILHHLIYQYIVKKTDLFITGCATALEFFATHFSIHESHCLRNTWCDKELDALLNYDYSRRGALRKKYGLPSNAKVVFNARRFKPRYCAEEAFAMCVKLAEHRDDTWFIFVEGYQNEKFFLPFINKIATLKEDISKRFIIMRDEVPMETMLELFCVSDAFLSLVKKGDMRSATILQGAAMGSIPILAKYREWELMRSNGFAAHLVDPDDQEAFTKSVSSAIDNSRAKVADLNRVYLQSHENDAQYFERFSHALNELVNEHGDSPD